MGGRKQLSGSATTVASLVTILGLLALAGCGKDKVTNTGGGGATSTTFEGTVSGNGVSGTLTLTAQTTTLAPSRAQAVVNMTGTAVLTPGGTVSLSGTYDNTADTFSVTGGGWTFAGGYSGFGLEGTFAGPTGESGVFSVQTVGSGADTVVVVTGSFAGTSSGVFNFSMRGTVLHGNAWEAGATIAIPLDGTFTATSGGAGTISITNPANPTGPALATGTMAANGAASGTWDDGAGGSGTWSGTKQ